MPPLSASFAAGNATVSGGAEDGSAVQVRRSDACVVDGDSLGAARTPGAFSATFPEPLTAGERVTVTLQQPDGDRLFLETRVSGETPCLSADGSTRLYDQGFFGSNPDAPPFAIYVGRLNDSSIPSGDVRTVLRRGSTVVKDVNSGSVELDAASRPLAGDVIDVYRPAAAGTPSLSFTLPAVNAVFDAGNDRVAIDAPASKWVEAGACRAVDCAGGSWRGATNAAAGRMLFDFTKPSEWGDAYDIRPNDQVLVDWTSPDRRLGLSYAMPCPAT